MWQKGHWLKDCWAKGGAKEGQFPKWWKITKNKDSATQSIEQSTDSKSGDCNFACYSNETTNISTSDWLADSAATTHILHDRSYFSNFTEDRSEIVGISLGTNLQTIGRGVVSIQFNVDKMAYSVRLRDVKFAPKPPNNLISVGRLTECGHTASFSNSGIQFKSQVGTIFGQGSKAGHVYVMHAQAKTTTKIDYVAFTQLKSWDTWHQILAHINPGVIKMLKTQNLVTGMDVDTNSATTQCVACIQGKQHVQPFSKRTEDTASQIGDLIVSDVWGPSNIEGPAWERYFYSFTDAKTRYTVLYFSHTKDMVLNCFKEYKAFLENHMTFKIKILCSDGGGEYTNTAFKNYCASNGIVMQFTAPYSSAQNGIAERLNHKHARAMLFAKQLPKIFWAEAVAYVCYIKNRALTKALGYGTTPYQALFGQKPNISRLQEFGQKCWVHIPDQHRTKLDPKAEEHIFTGVAKNAKAWRYFNT